MARTKIGIDKHELVTVISRLEAETKFTTRSQLAEAVAINLPTKVSAAVVLLRIKEFGIEPKTPKGKRGRQAGVKLTTAHKKAMQDGRKGRTVGNIAVLRMNFPQSRQGLLDKVENGSLSAAIKANCLECVQFQTLEIKNCECTSCPMWAFRPYQEK